MIALRSLRISTSCPTLISHLGTLFHAVQIESENIRVQVTWHDDFLHGEPLKLELKLSFIIAFYQHQNGILLLASCTEN